MKKLFIGLLFTLFCIGLSVDSQASETFNSTQTDIKDKSELFAKAKERIAKEANGVNAKWTGWRDNRVVVDQSNGTLVQIDSNHLYYEASVDIKDEIYRSYYKKQNGYWFHYKNVSIYKDDDGEDIESYYDAVTFYFNQSNCKNTIDDNTMIGLNCATRSKYQPNFARIHQLEELYDYDIATGAYSHRYISTFRNNDDDEDAITVRGYNERNQLIYIENNVMNSYGMVIQSTQEDREYYSNGKIQSRYIFKLKYSEDSFLGATLDYRENNTKGQTINQNLIKLNRKFEYNGSWEKRWRVMNNSRKLTYYVVNRANGSVSHGERRSYYSNGRQDMRYIIKRNTKNVITSGINTKHRSNGKIQFTKNMAYSNGKRTRMVTLQYNTAGQLRTNSNSKAFRFVTTFNNNGGVTQVTRAQYNSNGKRGNAVTVKVTNFTRVFKVVSVDSFNF